jgi:hypothetical protein
MLAIPLGRVAAALLTPVALQHVATRRTTEREAIESHERLLQDSERNGVLMSSSTDVLRPSRHVNTTATA